MYPFYESGFLNNTYLLKSGYWWAFISAMESSTAFLPTLGSRMLAEPEEYAKGSKRGVKCPPDTHLRTSSPWIWPVVSCFLGSAQETAPARTGEHSVRSHQHLLYYLLRDPISPSACCPPRATLPTWAEDCAINFPPIVICSSWCCFLQDPRLRWIRGSLP